MTNNQVIGVLRRYMFEHNMMIKEVAAACGVGKTTMGNWLNFKRSPRMADVINALENIGYEVIVREKQNGN